MDKKTTEQALRDKILYIGTQIPESLLSDTRRKFIVLGTPQEFIDETSDTPKLATDFYNDLPGVVCAELEDYWKKEYDTQEWFPKAWEEYRQHVKVSGIDDMKMPGFVFNKYLTPSK